jgi:hypothetical protein
MGRELLWSAIIHNGLMDWNITEITLHCFPTALESLPGLAIHSPAIGWLDSLKAVTCQSVEYTFPHVIWSLPIRFEGSCAGVRKAKPTF